MTEDKLNKSEKETMDRLIAETRDKLNKYRVMLAVMSFGLFVIVAYMTYTYWINPNISHLTSMVIGGQFYTVIGAVFTIFGALSKTSTIALMSMTRWDSNNRLFYELMKSRMSAIIGISFVGGGFLIQAIAILINETIGL